jgi:RNA polymerase sigma-70 factor, ECF subfamily
MNLRPLSLAYATRMLSGRIDDAEDVAQEVMVKLAEQIALRSLTSGLRVPDLRRFVIRATINAAIDVLRAEARAFQRHQRLAAQLPANDSDSSMDERLEELTRAVAQLKPSDRLLIHMQLEGKTMKQIAARSGLTYGAVAVRLHRIRRRLAKSMQISSLAESSEPVG